MNEPEIPREKYTWIMAAKDIALSTTLTIQQVGEITWEFRQPQINIHPYDALPLLIRVFKTSRGDDVHRMAVGIAELIKLSHSPIESSAQSQSASHRA